MALLTDKSARILRRICGDKEAVEALLEMIQDQDDILVNQLTKAARSADVLSGLRDTIAAAGGRSALNNLRSQIEALQPKEQ